MSWTALEEMERRIEAARRPWSTKAALMKLSRDELIELLALGERDFHPAADLDQ